MVNGGARDLLGTLDLVDQVVLGNTLLVDGRVGQGQPLLQLGRPGLLGEQFIRRLGLVFGQCGVDRRLVGRLCLELLDLGIGLN